MKDWFIKTHGISDGVTFQVIRWRIVSQKLSEETK